MYCRASFPRCAVTKLSHFTVPALSIRHDQRQFHTRGSLHSQIRSYNDAIDALNSLQTPFKLALARRKANIKPDHSSVLEMKAYLNRLDYQVSDLDRLNIVHIAGTKGKGSTCAFVDSILSQYRKTHGAPRRLGFFISPHLVAVRERIRIDGSPISEALFTKYFSEVWDRLGTSTASEHVVAVGSRPTYARFLTLVSWHVFLQEGVDAAVYETGIGGEFDATNLVARPVASGITTLGIDHTFALGSTIDKIAWHKAGIMKTGSPAFTVEQEPVAMQVLRARAVEKDVDLTEVKIDPRLRDVKLQPDAPFQKRNASLAIALAEAALAKSGIYRPAQPASTLPKEFVDGLEKAVFRGRCEIKQEDTVAWHLDGAHTSDSLKIASRWFSQVSNKSGPRVLIFNQQGRDEESIEFLNLLFDSANPSPSSSSSPFDHVIFSTNVTYASSGYKRDFVNNQFDPKEVGAMTVQSRFADRWRQLDAQCKITIVPTIEEALECVRSEGEGLPQGEKVQALVTGSLHLVGGALGILDKADAL